MHIKGLLPAVVVASAVSVAGVTFAQKPAPTVEVYKSPTCGCCANWVKHLQQHGFTTRVTDTADMASIKTQRGVPAPLQSCHTAVVDGYVLEGHVPAADVQRLLKERPAMTGLAVPGMPVGSPGMEMQGTPAQKYDVVLFDKQGQTKVYASH